MEILTTYTFNDKTLTVGDEFTVGEEYILYINEIFDIDGCVYLATSTNRDVIVMDEVEINRNIVSAELFVIRNTELLNAL
jgi:hypothetical protein